MNLLSKLKNLGKQLMETTTKINIGKTATIKMNGVSYSGQNISIAGRSITIDGKDVSGDHKDDHQLTIQLIGDVERIDTLSGNVYVHGDVNGDVSTLSGDISIENSVGGDVETLSGDVTAKTIAGVAYTMSGSVLTKL